MRLIENKIYGSDIDGGPWVTYVKWEEEKHQPQEGNIQFLLYLSPLPREKAEKI